MNAPTTFTLDQLQKLDTLIERLTEARSAATASCFFGSRQGWEATKAAADFFEVEGMFDLADTVRHDAGIIDDTLVEIPELRLITTQVRRLDPEIWGDLS